MGPFIILEGPITRASYSELIEAHIYPTIIAMYDSMENYVFQQDNP